MPRRVRLLLPEIPVHVIQRGIDRAACFFSDEDRQVYLDTLGGLARSGGVAIHAYGLMTNHVHRLVTASAQPNLSALMKGLGQRYVQYVNRTYHRTGTLWEGRFRSCLVEADAYFFACQRYVELNPVRTGMVLDPAAYPWSSFTANAGARPDAVITPHPLYLTLGPTPATRATVYQALFTEVLDPAWVDSLRACTNGGFVLGSDRFQRQVAAMVGRRTWKGSLGRPENRLPIPRSKRCRFSRRLG